MPALALAEDKELDWTQGQTTTSVGARMAAGIDYKVARGLHLNYEAELRLTDNFSKLGRVYNTLGIDYKVTNWLKLGAGFSLINVNSTDDGWRNRQRYMFDATFSRKFDRLELSFRERVQATHKSYSVNLYQTPQTNWALRHRIKAEYNIPHCKFDPFASIELKNTLNAVNPNAFVYSTSTGRWYNTSPKYNDVYINRLRVIVGGAWKINKKNVLDIYAVMDGNYDLDIDLNKNGVSKKSGAAYLTLQDSYFFGLGLSYRFKAGR